MQNTSVRTYGVPELTQSPYRGPYRNLLNDKVYLAFAQPQNQASAVSASEFIRQRRKVQIGKPNVTNEEMNRMLQNYRDQMIYLKGGVKAALEHGIGIEQVGLSYFTTNPKPQQHASGREKLRVHFDVHESGFDDLQTKSLQQRRTSHDFPSLDDDLLELNQQAEILARQRSSKDSDFYRATDELFKGRYRPSEHHDYTPQHGISGAGLERASTNRLNYLEEFGQFDGYNDSGALEACQNGDAAAEQMDYTMSPPTPPEVNLTNLQQEINDAVLLNQSIEEYLTQTRQSSVASAFQSQSVQRSRNPRDELNLDDFDDVLPIYQQFAECCLSSVVRSQSSHNPEGQLFECAHACTGSQRHEGLSPGALVDDVRHDRSQQFLTDQSAQEDSPACKQGSDDEESSNAAERTKRSVLQVVQRGANKANRSLQSPQEPVLSAIQITQKHAVCSTIYSYCLKPADAKPRSGPKADGPLHYKYRSADRPGSNPAARHSFVGTAATQRQAMARQQAYIARIRREAEARKAQKRAEEREIRLRLGLGE